ICLIKKSASPADRGCLVNQILLSRKAASWDLDRAPTLVASTLPSLNSISVGIPRTPYFGGVSVFSSMFSLQILSLPSSSREMSSTTGAIILHRLHHSAH